MSDSTEQHPLELLPWLVNGTLSGAERDRVERHVAGCHRCRAEVQVLEAMRRGVKAGPSAGAGDLGWQRLRRSLRRERPATPRWVLPAAVAASLVIVAQSVLLLQGPGEPAHYEPLSGPVSSGPVLQVRFVPQAREADLRALLRDSGLRIIDGPSAAGVYRLAVESPRDPVQAADALGARPDLIGHVALED